MLGFYKEYGEKYPNLSEEELREIIYKDSQLLLQEGLLNCYKSYYKQLSSLPPAI